MVGLEEAQWPQRKVAPNAEWWWVPYIGPWYKAPCLSLTSFCKWNWRVIKDFQNSKCRWIVAKYCWKPNLSGWLPCPQIHVSTCRPSQTFISNPLLSSELQIHQKLQLLISWFTWSPSKPVSCLPAWPGASPSPVCPGHQCQGPSPINHILPPFLHPSLAKCCLFRLCCVCCRPACTACQPLQGTWFSPAPSCLSVFRSQTGCHGDLLTCQWDPRTPYWKLRLLSLRAILDPASLPACTSHSEHPTSPHPCPVSSISALHRLCPDASLIAPHWQKHTKAKPAKQKRPCSL